MLARRCWTSRVARQQTRQSTRPPLVQHGRSRRQYAVAVPSHGAAELAQRTRNIGIIAHIDAGKTTTTERMLYYSGYTRRIGDVDDGSTVTDFLPAERARGITIQSAAITFHWPPPAGTGDAQSYTVNLIDTPGHADFTFEVLRSLRILDGAVCILDGVAGVEAQTEMVWQQARTYGIPKLIYINKLDREGAAFGRTVREIAAKLHVYPAVCQIPWFEGGQGEFTGVVDIVSLRAMRWHGGDGKSIALSSLAELDASEPKLAAEARKARIALVEMLSEHDDYMVDAFLQADEDHLAVPAADIVASLRGLLLSSAPVVPVFAGASFRNIGVQPVIDAVTNLLPNPNETPDPQVSLGSTKGGLRDLAHGGLLAKVAHTAHSGAKKTKKTSIAMPSKLETCALAFKVTNDPRRGVLVYVRVYHGSLKKQTNLYNTNLRVLEKAPRLLRMYANDAVEVDSIEAGQIGVITGLKHARTGDTLLTYAGMNPKSGPPAPLNDLQLRPIEVPPPVFFSSIEPHSLAEQKATEEALAVLLREDPSLQLSVNEETGQTLLSGMGELHLEIARDRLVNDLKAKCTVGKIEISFRECLHAASPAESVLFDREIAGKAGKARCTASVEPLTREEYTADGTQRTETGRAGNEVSVTVIREAPSRPDSEDSNDASGTLLPPNMEFAEVEHALRNGAEAALARGPNLAFPMNSVRVAITIDPLTDFFGTETTASALSAAARLATQAALRKSHAIAPTGLMEPVMNVLITVTEETLGSVVHDLTSARGGHVISLDDENGDGGNINSNAAGLASQDRRSDNAAVDLKRVYAPPDPWDAGQGVRSGDAPAAQRDGNRPRTITAKVPLKEMVGYLKYLRSLTKGRGTFVMSVDQFEKMSANREKTVLKELRGGF